MNRLCLVASLDDAPTRPGQLPDASGTGFTRLDAPSIPKPPAEATEERQAPLVIDLLTLARFKALMSGQGWRVETVRMIFDRSYAHERLAWAHGSHDATLRCIALDMFRRLHANDGQPQAGVAPH